MYDILNNQYCIVVDIFYGRDFIDFMYFVILFQQIRSKVTQIEKYLLQLVFSMTAMEPIVTDVMNSLEKNGTHKYISGWVVQGVTPIPYNELRRIKLYHCILQYIQHRI